jgi:hypothetical protein
MERSDGCNREVWRRADEIEARMRGAWGGGSVRRGSRGGEVGEEETSGWQVRCLKLKKVENEKRKRKKTREKEY